jgi:hypothetical protein
MIAVGLLSMLTGVVLGMHFRVFVLVPATVLACAVIAAFGIVGRDTFWWPAIIMMVAAASLQAGYLVGSARALSADARTRGFALHREPGRPDQLFTLLFRIERA